MNSHSAGSGGQRMLDNEEISAFAIGTALLRGWRRVAKYALVGGLIALPLLFLPARTYTAKASFVPVSSGDAGKAGIASLAGQFGLSLGSSAGQEQSSEFYAELVRARAVLAPILLDSLEVEGSRQPILDLLNVDAGEDAVRLDEALAQLADGMITTSVSTQTRVVSLSVKTRVPDLSLALVRRIVDAVNEFNLRSRRSQATREREFTERRLADAHDSLRIVEDALGRFLQANRQFLGSPLLVFEHDRLQRAVALRQGVLTALATSLEDVRAREVRDTPVITIVEAPYLPARPDRRPLVLVLAGLFVGFMLGMVVVVSAELVRRRRAAGDADVTGFLDAFTEMRTAVKARVRALRS